MKKMQDRKTVYDDFSKEELIDLLIKRDRELDNLKKKYHVMSRDELTDTLNRQAGFELLTRKLKRNNQLIICLLDMNNLKKINDNEGHLAGDNAIRTMVETIEHYIPKGTVMIRIGGDEFVLVFNKAELSQVRSLLLRIKKVLKEKSEGKQFPITFSFGLIDASKYPDLSIKEILDKVDKTMYKQKKATKLKDKAQSRVKSIFSMFG
jgi:diguanylate cyclase (GGDEF)-like protein